LIPLPMGKITCYSSSNIGINLSLVMVRYGETLLNFFIFLFCSNWSSDSEGNRDLVGSRSNLALLLCTVWLSIFLQNHVWDLMNRSKIIQNRINILSIKTSTKNFTPLSKEEKIHEKDKHTKEQSLKRCLSNL
jgi:hypothetical protein